ncbi:MAG: HAMP domain-containing histidine kinase [Paludibacteraceae bacterium]|nr:HAMP domain-containing histidine kinase [Paludibacteraceae bacterium]
MPVTRFAPRRLRSGFLLAALLIVIVSVLYANNLARRLAGEERRKMEIWAEATRQFILADENTDIDFVSGIIEQNTTIPVYMVDAEGRFLLSRNVREPKHNADAFYRRKIAELQASQQPIEVRISDEIVQYIYYEDSTLLRQLQYFPYVQFTIIFLFILVMVFTLYTVQRSEQNRVWVGLSKETAHQLGTPISSLSGWSELLKAAYPDDALIPEMDKDIRRLRTIAERFSKIGSEPELADCSLQPVLQEAVDYMRSRTSSKVNYSLCMPSAGLCVRLNVPLFEWVIENLCKNAVDAMEGVGAVTIRAELADGKVHIDVSDTGHGIERRRWKTVFLPGYTSKRRGWGLGLSLAKRIVEEYHDGRIFVLRSSSEGTTFRISLAEAKP